MMRTRPFALIRATAAVLAALLLPFVATAQTDNIHFYFEIVPPPLLDSVLDSVEVKNGYYLHETEALEQPPLELSSVRFDLAGLKTRPADEKSYGSPIIQLELGPMDYRTEAGIDREYGGKPCREVLVKIPLAHGRNETLQAHIRCARPTEHDPDNFTTANRYVGASSTHYELVAVRIFRKSSARTPAGGGAGNSGGKQQENPSPTAPTNPSGTGSGSGSSSVGAVGGGTTKPGTPSKPTTPSNWYNISKKLKEEVGKLKDIKNAQDKADKAKRLELELSRIEKVYVIDDLVRELKAAIEESVKAGETAGAGAAEPTGADPAQEVEDIMKEVLDEVMEESGESAQPEQPAGPVYETGDDVYVEIVPPAPLHPKDSIVLDINYHLPALTDAKLKNPDYQMYPVLLDIERHKTRPGDGRSNNRPVILLDLFPEDYRHAMWRDMVYNGKPCREIIVHIPFYHTTAKIIPAHIICPRPAYDVDGSVQDLWGIPPLGRDGVFVAMRIFQKADVLPGPPDMGVWTITPQKPLEYMETAPVDVKFTAPTLAGFKFEAEWLPQIPEGHDFVSYAVELPSPGITVTQNTVTCGLPVNLLRSGGTIDGDEWFVLVSLANVEPGTVTPARIFAPSPADQTKPVEVIPVKTGENEAVFFRLRSATVVDWNGKALHVPHYMPHFVRTYTVNYKSMNGEYVYPEYAYCRDYGLITLSGTGKYFDHEMSSGDKKKDEWLEITVTDLGREYLVPKDQWKPSDQKSMAKVYREWKNPYSAEDNPDMVARHKRAIEQGWGFPEREHAGKPENIAVFDIEAIHRDIAAGKLKQQ